MLGSEPILSLLFCLNQFYCSIRPNDKCIQQTMAMKTEIRKTYDFMIYQLWKALAATSSNINYVIDTNRGLKVLSTIRMQKNKEYQIFYSANSWKYI